MPRLTPPYPALPRPAPLQAHYNFTANEARLVKNWLVDRTVANPTTFRATIKVLALSCHCGGGGRVVACQWKIPPPPSTPALLPHIARLQPSNPCHLVAVVHNINAGLRNHTFLNHLQQAANVPTLVSARSGAQWG